MVKHPLTAFRQRHEPEMPLEKLADELGVERETVWRWENWKRFPDRGNWPSITRLTGITADQMASVEREHKREEEAAKAA